MTRLMVQEQLEILSIMAQCYPEDHLWSNTATHKGQQC